MKKIALLFNGHRLGGAERSMVHQLAHLQGDVTAWIFDLGAEREIEDFICELYGDQVKTQRWKVPRALYSLSRSSTSGWFLAILSAFFYLFYWPLKARELKKYDIVYANGVKAALIAFVLMLMGFHSGVLIWHWRDYPQRSWPWKLMMKIPRRFNLRWACNSESVAQELKICLGQNELAPQELQIIPNPSGMEENKVKELSPFGQRVIGLVAMQAPWKGSAWAILLAHFFEKDLKALGVEKIALYGAQIYSTQGDHSDFPSQLHRLKKNYPSKLIEFRGHQSPQKIFNEIDVLWHTSLRAEPFGRVIVEAYKGHVPVISTALGGAGELCANGLAQVAFAHDYSGVLQSLEEIFQNPEKTKQCCERAALFAKELEELIGPRLRALSA